MDEVVVMFLLSPFTLRSISLSMSSRPTRTLPSGRHISRDEQKYRLKMDDGLGGR